VLLGGGPDHLEREVELLDPAREREGRAERGAGDEVVPAAVADAGQRIVLHAQRGDQGAGPAGGAEGGGQLRDAALDDEAGVLEQVRAAVVRAMLLEGGLGIGVEGTGQGAHLGAAGVVGGTEGGVVGHGSILPRGPMARTARSADGRAQSPERSSGGISEVPPAARYRRAGRPPVGAACRSSSSRKPSVRVALRWKLPASRVVPHTLS